MKKNLMSVLRYTVVVVLVASLFVISGCGEDEEQPTKSIYELISENADLSAIKAQLDATTNADLKASLSAAGTFTFFAPSNTAMTNLLNALGLTDFATIAPQVVITVLNYHLVESVKMSGDLVAGTVLTKQGENITITVSGTGEKKLDTGASSDAAFVTSDVKATNGVLHVVDVVLVPPTIGAVVISTLGKVSQPILLGAAFTTLAAGIAKADAGKAPASTIIGALTASSAITIFAPVNDVFAAASITAASKTADEWDALVRGHIVLESISTLAAGTKNTMNAKVLTLTTSTVKGVGNANAIPVVVNAKVTQGNGVVWPIGGIIINP